MTIDRHFIHDSLYRSLEMRDTLANSGETAGASAAQKLADRLWELTKPPATPIQTTGPTGEAEREIARREAALDKPRSETNDPRNPFEDHDHLVARAADGAPTGAATETDAGNPFEGL